MNWEEARCRSSSAIYIDDGRTRCRRRGDDHRERGYNADCRRDLPDQVGRTIRAYAVIGPSSRDPMAPRVDQSSRHMGSTGSCRRWWRWKGQENAAMKAVFWLLEVCRHGGDTLGPRWLMPGPQLVSFSVNPARHSRSWGRRKLRPLTRIRQRPPRGRGGDTRRDEAEEPGCRPPLVMPSAPPP